MQHDVEEALEAGEQQIVDGSSAVMCDVSGFLSWVLVFSLAHCAEIVILSGPQHVCQKLSANPLQVIRTLCRYC